MLNLTIVKLELWPIVHFRFLYDYFNFRVHSSSFVYDSLIIRLSNSVIGVVNIIYLQFYDYFHTRVSFLRFSDFSIRIRSFINYPILRLNLPILLHKKKFRASFCSIFLIYSKQLTKHFSVHEFFFFSPLVCRFSFLRHKLCTNLFPTHFFFCN